MFEWNPDKAQRNEQKHGITFEEAATIFDDADLWTEQDVAHSEMEERFFAYGVSEQGRVLFVSFMYRGDIIRIISARKATPREREFYERNQAY